jgi:hypothetical protein
VKFALVHGDDMCTHECVSASCKCFGSCPNLIAPAAVKVQIGLSLPATTQYGSAWEGKLSRVHGRVPVIAPQMTGSGVQGIGSKW